MKARTISLTALALVAGIAVGVGGYTFVYAKGYSYLSNDPGACANCHVMEEQFSGWHKSSHHGVATCNDCHTPAGFVAKYLTKAENGFWHSFHFTTGDYPDPIRIKARNRAITEQACRECHSDIVEMMDAPHKGANTTSCIRCHASVGHMK